LALRAKATSINDKKEEIHRKVCSFSCLVSASCFFVCYHSPPKKTNQVL
jgi:hypothetical protein